MPDAQARTKGQGGSVVLISNTAANMLSSLHPHSRNKAQAAIENIKSDIDDPTKVKKLIGYDNVFVAYGHGMRVVFTREGDSSVVTSVSADA